VKHLSPEQVARLIEAADGDRNRLLFRVLFEHGLRISEALSLTRGSVRRGYLRVQPTKRGKPSDERMSPSTLQLWDKVTGHILPTTLVFPVSRQWCGLLFHRAASKAGIELQPRMGVHCLRHSAAHALLDAGAGLNVVQRALRHRSIGSTGVYLQCDGADVDRWRARAVMGGGTGEQVFVQAAALATVRQTNATAT
jgi:integrase/recombinase XerD